MYNIKLADGLSFVKELDDSSIDLVLTDPPYMISHDTGLNRHYVNVSNGLCRKTLDDWNAYTAKHSHLKFNQLQKSNYLDYGSIYGKKYAVQTNYDAWDKQFNIDTLQQYIEQFYRVLKHGGVCIIFFDIWKIETLKSLLETCKFRQIRFIEWIKSNPQPLNSRVNYLTNSREVALVSIKGRSPVFNTKYHNGIFEYPIYSGSDRFHPTQKNVKLFEELIRIHTNEGANVLDPFLGSGTTAIASIHTNRHCFGCENNEQYFNNLIKRIT